MRSNAPYEGVAKSAAAPGSPAEGDLYYNMTTHKLMVWNATVWVDATFAAGGTSTGTGAIVFGTSPTFTTGITVNGTVDVRGATGALTFDRQETGAIWKWYAAGGASDTARLNRQAVGDVVTVSNAGMVNALAGYQINTIPLGAGHLSNGTTGTGAVVLAAAPTVTGQLNASGTLRVGANAPISAALVSAVQGGDGVEFGHSNTAGFRGVLGAEVNSGKGFLAFHARAGTTVNTYQTNGVAASIMRATTSGAFEFGTLASAAADNQSLVVKGTLDASGFMDVVGGYKVNTTALAASHLSNGVSGSGKVVLESSAVFTGAPTITIAGATATFAVLNSTAAQQAVFNFSDGGTLKWQVGKQTDNTFFIYDNSNARNALIFSGAGSDATFGGGITAYANITASGTTYAQLVLYNAAGGLNLKRSRIWNISNATAIQTLDDAYTTGTDRLVVDHSNGNIRIPLPGTLAVGGAAAARQTIDLQSGHFIVGNGQATGWRNSANTGWAGYMSADATNIVISRDTGGTTAATLGITTGLWTFSGGVTSIGPVTIPTAYGANFVAEDNTAWAANVGGSITFRGQYGAGNADFAAISGVKANATSGNHDGLLRFFIRQTGSSLFERATLDTTGLFTASQFQAGTATPAFAANATAVNGLLRNKLLSGDTQAAFLVLGDGTISWGQGGSTPRDLTLARASAGLFSVTASSFPGAALVGTSITADKIGFIFGGGNRLVNSSFETSGTDGTGAAITAYNFWSLTNVTSPTAIGTGTGSPANGRVVHGNTALQIQPTAGATALQIDQGITNTAVRFITQPAVRHVVSAWAGANVTGRTARMRVRWYDSTGAQLNAAGGTSTPIDVDVTFTISTSTGMTRFIGTYLQNANLLSPANTAFGSYAFIIDSTGVVTTDRFYVDALQLEVGEYPTTYSPNPAEVLPGSINATSLQAGTIVGASINATLDMTSKLIRTASSQGRVEIDGTNNRVSIFSSTSPYAEWVRTSAATGLDLIYTDVDTTPVAGRKIRFLKDVGTQTGEIGTVFTYGYDPGLGVGGFGGSVRVQSHGIASSTTEVGSQIGLIAYSKPVGTAEYNAASIGVIGDSGASNVITASAKASSGGTPYTKNIIKADGTSDFGFIDRSNSAIAYSFSIDKGGANAQSTATAFADLKITYANPTGANNVGSMWSNTNQYATVVRAGWYLIGATQVFNPTSGTRCILEIWKGTGGVAPVVAGRLARFGDDVSVVANPIALSGSTLVYLNANDTILFNAESAGVVPLETNAWGSKAWMVFQGV